MFIAYSIFLGLCLYEAFEAITHAFLGRHEANREYYDACQDWLERNHGSTKE